MLKTYDASYLTETKLPTIPILISEGLRNALSIDTGDNNLVLLENNLDVKPAQVVGLMAKASHSAFTARKVEEFHATIGKAVITSMAYYNILLNDMIERQPSIKVLLE